MIEDILAKIGLIPSEIKLYQALLELGPQGANVLSKKTGIKRANVYYFLDGLKEKGLISQISDMAGIKRFRAERPEKIISYLDQQEKDIRRKKEITSHIIPELRQLYQKKSYRIPKVSYYEGKKSVQRLYENIFSSQTKEVMAFANIDVVGAIFPSYTWKLENIIPEKNISMKELIVNTKSAIKYKQKLTSKLHQIKILPSHFSFDTDILLYQNKVVFISYHQIITAFVIEDDLIFAAQKNIFNGLWKK
ncbi:MAG: helix-turn-helix domain-containing protein [Patescibacteria group bacterium]